MTPAPATQPITLPTSERVQHLVRFFETLTPASVAQLGVHYAAQARFTDPFNDVVGVSAIARIFEHMFTTLRQPRFIVTGQVEQGNQCFLTWEFRFFFKTHRCHEEQVILGTSHLVWSGEGLVVVHRDYWDAAQELYEKLPVLGSVMRWLRRRMSH